MTNRYLISVAAAALIAGTGFANAQGAGGTKSEGTGSSVQHSASAGTERVRPTRVTSTPVTTAPAAPQTRDP